MPSGQTIAGSLGRGSSMIAWNGLSHSYASPTRTATIRFADFSAPQGAHLLLRGASGSGKSTLLALLAGLLTPTSGQVQVAGGEPARFSSQARDAWRGETIGFIPQRLHLSDRLSVTDNLALPYVAAGLPVDVQRIAEVLKRLGLDGLEARRPGALSVGQAQRVAIARALLRRPRLILADEPTAHLDDAHASAAVALLDQVATELGATLVIATHDSRLSACLPRSSALVLPTASPPAEAVSS
jgi:putative ABC transport system ATP-binding protein